MIVEIDGKGLDVDNDITLEELIELARDLIDNHESLTELKVDQETVSQSTLQDIKGCPIADFSESKIELFSTTANELVSELLEKATEYIKRVENAQDLTGHDLKEIIKGFQWLSFALIQIYQAFDWQKDNRIQDLMKRNSHFCEELATYKSKGNLVKSGVKKRINRELRSYQHLINQAKEQL